MDRSSKSCDVIDDRPDAQVFRVRRDIFSDSELFEQELRTLFEQGWIYLAHESQLPNPNDYLTVQMGRRPVVVMRDGGGVVRAFHNACPHRGAVVCRLDHGNSAFHVCPYHSWSFNSDGRQKGLKAKAPGGYTDKFLSEARDLVPIARFEEYRGFYFGSLAADVPSLADYLGDAAMFLDLVVDQGPEGYEYLPGVSAFTYNGNWKYQLENCSDGYHVTSVHPTYMKVAQQRAEANKLTDVSGVWGRTKNFLDGADTESKNGSFRFDNGHVVAWAASPVSPGHPLFDNREEIFDRVGPVRGKWMFYTRNLTIFPNLQIAENFSSQIRVLRPLAPDRTEMTTYCVGPRGEPPAARRKRLRQYEDFFNPSGMATPDDLAVYEDCQKVATAAQESWHSYDRGMALQTSGANEEARELSVRTVGSVRGSGQLWDETLMHAYYRAWSERMARATAKDVGR